MELRARILLPCAAIMGIAAGINCAHVHIEQSKLQKSSAIQIGFDSSGDYEVISHLVNEQHIKSLNDREIQLLDKYCIGSGRTPTYVGTVLCNVADDGLARNLVPVARKLGNHAPSNLIVQDLPESWRRNGCIKAAASIKEDTPWRESATK